MAPHVEIDESHVNVAGKQAHALVLCAPDVVIIRIESNKTKVVMNRVFHMVQDRPLGADMFRAAGAFKGVFQTCVVHVWRKSESLAVKHGIKSPEHTYSI